MFDQVTAYHRQHGDDYGSEESRKLKYAVIAAGLRLRRTGLPQILLDVGCGSGNFKDFLAHEYQLCKVDYVGIDLLAGQNILDITTRYDILVANGIFYKLGIWLSAQEIIAHMWTLTKETLAFNSLSTWTPHKNPDELYLDPIVVARWCQTMTTKLVLRHDYMPHDFTIFMYR